MLIHKPVTYRTYDIDLSGSTEAECIFSKTKHYDFEKEYRLVFDLNQNPKLDCEYFQTEKGILFDSNLDFTNSAVVLGFGMDNSTTSSLKRILINMGYPKDQIHFSEINQGQNLEQTNDI